jgi:hypothetical protein
MLRHCLSPALRLVSFGSCYFSPGAQHHKDLHGDRLGRQRQDPDGQ